MTEGFVGLVLVEFSLTRSFICVFMGQTSLVVHLPMGQVSDVIGILQFDVLFEVLSVHGRGELRQLVFAGPEPGEALLCGHLLRDGEKPMNRVQFGVAVNTAIVPEISPAEEAKVAFKINTFVSPTAGAKTGWGAVSPRR